MIISGHVCVCASTLMASVNVWSACVPAIIELKTGQIGTSTLRYWGVRKLVKQDKLKVAEFVCVCTNKSLIGKTFQRKIHSKKTEFLAIAGPELFIAAQKLPPWCIALKAIFLYLSVFTFTFSFLAKRGTENGTEVIAVMHRCKKHWDNSIAETEAGQNSRNSFIDALNSGFAVVWALIIRWVRNEEYKW